MRFQATRRTPGHPLRHAVRALGAIAVLLVVIDAVIDHRPAPGGGSLRSARQAGAAAHDDGGAAAVHDQDAPPDAPVPATYKRRHAPPGIWTDPAILQRGETVYRQHCVACHGERGDGRGPGAAALTPKPADMTDRAAAQMTDSYWFWRVSEGGRVEPFVSRGSAMPAWRGMLSVDDRWAVIAYQHTFGGHRGAARQRVTGSSR